MTRDKGLMAHAKWTGMLLAVLLGAAILLLGATGRWRSFFVPGPWGADAATGDELYLTFCATCHGADGRGDGVAAPFCKVPPADLTRAEFKVRSTPMGALPTDADLAGVIRRGAGGDGAMPSFAFLKDEDVSRLVARVKAFSPRWQTERVPPEVALPPRVEGDAARGEQVYLSWECASCHGASGKGDGPRARELLNARGLAEIPTDLTRPWTFKAGSDEASLARSTLTGFSGTTMPGRAVQAGSERSVWDVAAYMRSLQTEPPAPSADVVDTSAVEGYWHSPVPLQSGDLSSVACGTCHAAQFGDWTHSRHAIAMGPGVWAQTNDQPEMSGMCARCHTPLRNQWTDQYLSSDGVSCAACHLRGGQKFGPPPLETSIAPLVSRYPSPQGRVNARDFFESVEFCGTCHQFAEGRAPKINGAFLENTVEEWKASRAAREGKTCQTCHMPGRRHLFRGIHDPETVRNGVEWRFDARLEGNGVVSRMTLTNTNTGHDFPTYVVPEVWMRIEAVDAYGTGRVVAERLISRRVAFENGDWQEVADTRLGQDETATLEYAGALPASAVALVGTVVVRPDAYHVASFERRLLESPSAGSRRAYEQALSEMRNTDYVLFREERRMAR